MKKRTPHFKCHVLINEKLILVKVNTQTAVYVKDGAKQVMRGLQICQGKNLIIIRLTQNMHALIKSAFFLSRSVYSNYYNA